MGVSAVKPVVYAISGYKNSGKTTLMTRLIRELTHRGFLVATIKHDGHDFTPDVPGTDSFRHGEAGAYGTAVFSGNRFMITKQCTSINEGVLMAAFPEADVILMEGLKHSPYPKTVCRFPQEPLPDEKAIADEIQRRMEAEA